MAAKMVPTVVVKRNLPYFRQQFSAALKNSSVVVKFICLTVFLCYFLSYSENITRCIVVTPGFIIPPNFWVWTAFTHCFLEKRIWLVLTDIITVGLCGKLIEPLWGALEMLTFFAIVNTSVAFLSVMFYIIVYTATSDHQYLFNIHINGLAGYCAGVAVAVKQIMPDHILLSTPLGKLRNRNVPLCVLLLSLILCLLGLVRSTYPVMFTAGLLTSWVYLRFYQHHTNGTRGDMADHFTFASFFPNVLQPPLSVVSNTIFEFLVRIKICRKPVRKYNIASSSSITVSLPGTDPQDAERRRCYKHYLSLQIIPAEAFNAMNLFYYENIFSYIPHQSQIALRALTERLSKVEQPAWPSLVEEEEGATKNTAEEKGKHVTIAIPPVPQHIPQTSSTTAEDVSAESASKETATSEKT